MKLPFVLSFLLLISLNLYTGCGLGEEGVITEDTPEEPVLSIENANIKTLEMVTFHSTQGNLEETYFGVLGDEDITLKRVSDSTLIALIPDMPGGRYEFVTDLGNIDLNITQTTLTVTPSETVAQFVNGYEEEIEAMLSLYTAGSAPAYLTLAREEIAQALQSFQNLSEEEQLMSAVFIQNNSQGMEEVKSLLEEVNFSAIGEGNRLGFDCDGWCIAANLVKVLGAAYITKLSGIAAITAAVALGVEVGLSIVFNRNSILITALYKGLKTLLSLPFIAQTTFAEETYDFAEQNIANFRSNATVYEFKDKIPVSFNIKPTFRTLAVNDKEHPNGQISTFVSLYTKFKNTWEATLKPKYGAIPAFVAKEEQQFAKELSMFSIEITANAENVEVSDKTGTVEDFKVTFTNKTSAEQEFTFDIIFNDNGIIAKKSITAKLVPFTFDFTGSWLLQNYRADSQSGGEYYPYVEYAFTCTKDGKSSGWKFRWMVGSDNSWHSDASFQGLTISNGRLFVDASAYAYQVTSPNQTVFYSDYWDDPYDPQYAYFSRSKLTKN